MGPRRRRAPEEAQAGSVSAEIVLVIPALMFLLLLSVQFGLWFHATAVAKAAAEEGVRAARVEGATEADGEDRTRSFLLQLGKTVVSRPRVVVTQSRDEARVEVVGRAMSVVPGLHPPIRAVAASPVEAYRSPAEP